VNALPDAVHACALRPRYRLVLLTTAASALFLESRISLASRSTAVDASLTPLFAFAYCCTLLRQVGEKRYNFVNLQLHSSAEHTLGGGASDAELQLLHTNAADATDVLIIAVQLQAQATDMADNTVMAAVLSKLTGTTFANVAVLASPYGECVFLQQCCLICAVRVAVLVLSQ
jgi:hypothetical protein